MNQTVTLPSYADTTEALQNMESDIPSAEAHGLLCGIICTTRGKIDMGWEKLLSGAQKNQQSVELLRQLYGVSFQQLTDFSLDFALLLPNDEADINERAEALGIWCQGFLTGLQQNPQIIEDSASPEVTEALNDITEIAQINYGDITDTDEDEKAYLELVEYVRLAVLMLYQEFNANMQSDEASESNALH